MHIKSNTKCPGCSKGYPKECSVENCGGLLHAQTNMSMVKTKRDIPKLLSTDLFCDTCGFRETIIPKEEAVVC